MKKKDYIYSTQLPYSLMHLTAQGSSTRQQGLLPLAASHFFSHHASFLFPAHIITLHQCLFISKIGQEMERHSSSFSFFGGTNSSTELVCQVSCQRLTSFLSIILTQCITHQEPLPRQPHQSMMFLPTLCYCFFIRNYE